MFTVGKARYLLPSDVEIKQMRKMREEGVAVNVICSIFHISKKTYYFFTEKRKRKK